MTNKTKQNRNRRDNNSEDDDYIYPTAKIRETKTRNRRSGKNQIKDGLLAYEHPDDTSEEMEADFESNNAIMDDYNDIIEEFNAAENKEGGFSDAVFEFNQDFGYEWEDY